MVGHYLLTLCPEAEHDVLTAKMEPGMYLSSSGARCLVGCAADAVLGENGWGRPSYAPRRGPQVSLNFHCFTSVEASYDGLCVRFGTRRINAAIRSRILSNQARRALSGVREVVEQPA